MAPVRFYNSRTQSGLEALAHGASEGINTGLAMQEMQRRRARDAESDRRYNEEKEAAVKEANREVANDVFRKNLQGLQEQRAQAGFDINKAQNEAANQSSQDIAQQAVTSGLKEGAMGPHSQEDEFALNVARRMSPEMLPRFMEELHREKRTKMLLSTREQHLSELQALTAEPGAAEFMDDAIVNRIKSATETLQQAQDPEQLAQILPTTKEAIDKTRDLLAERHARKQEVEAVGGYYQQQLAADMQNAMLERNPAIKAWKLGQIDQQRRYLGAFMTSKPGSVKTADFMARMAMMDNDLPASLSGGGRPSPEYTYDDAVVTARRELGDMAEGDKIRTRAEELYRQRNVEPKYQGMPTDEESIGHEMAGVKPPDISTPEGKRAALSEYLKSLGIDPKTPAPKKKGKLGPTGDKALDEIMRNAPSRN